MDSLTPSVVGLDGKRYSDAMSTDTTRFRQQLIDDYQGAVIQLATLRADGKQYLLFAWVELYPFDMDAPDGWNSGKRPWTIPQTQGWSCAFSAKKLHCLMGGAPRSRGHSYHARAVLTFLQKAPQGARRVRPGKRFDALGSI